jgi:threonine dehydrogenase-like Zn-dependent dehydrogenase
MSEWYRVPEQHLVPLPDGLDVRDASLCEPGSVSWHALRACGVGPGTRVCVVGGGAIGLLAAAGAQQLGASDVALEARHPHQHEAREKFGIAEPSGLYDVVVEAAGSASAVPRAIDLAAPRGTVVLIGLYPFGTEFPFLAALGKELNVRSSLGDCTGSHGHAHGKDFVEVAAMLAARPELADTLVSHRFPIEDAAEAFRVTSDKSQRSLRVVVEPT